MSNDTSAASAAPETRAHARDGSAQTDEYDRIADLLTEVCDQARYKAIGDGRIRDESRERVRVNYLNALIRACKERREAVESAQLNELAERVEAIENDEHRW